MRALQIAATGMSAQQMRVDTVANNLANMSTTGYNARRADFAEFVDSFKPGKIHARKATWSESNPIGRWRSFAYEDLLKRDKLSLDLFWLKDESLDDGDSLPEPDVIAAEIADDLEAAMEQFAEIAGELRSTEKG